MAHKSISLQMLRFCMLAGSDEKAETKIGFEAEFSSICWEGTYFISYDVINEMSVTGRACTPCHKMIDAAHCVALISSEKEIKLRHRRYCFMYGKLMS